MPYLRVLLFLNLGALLFGITHMLISTHNAESVQQKQLENNRHETLDNLQQLIR